MINYYYYACTPADLIWTKCLSSDSTPAAHPLHIIFQTRAWPCNSNKYIHCAHSLAPARSLTWLHARMPLCPGCDTHTHRESRALCVIFTIAHPTNPTLSHSSAFVCAAQNTAGCIHTPLIHSELFNKEAGAVTFWVACAHIVRLGNCKERLQGFNAHSAAPLFNGDDNKVDLRPSQTVCKQF
jgi:hypothetical protein